ncbi:MAG: hypothetical protein H7Y09_03895 [Chitinophagaceae bacterium]|nr:hypothetical protein [Anaerolineae bacterium]
MREDLIRDIVGRLMTDAEFRDQVSKAPGSLFGQYDLSEDERDTLFNMDIEGIQLQQLGTRLSASFGRAIRTGAAGDEEECGCCPTKHSACYPRNCT